MSDGLPKNSTVASRLAPSAQATRIDAAFAGRMMLMTSARPSVSRAYASAAAAPSRA